VSFKTSDHLNAVTRLRQAESKAWERFMLCSSGVKAAERWGYPERHKRSAFEREQFWMKRHTRLRRLVAIEEQKRVDLIAARLVR
jgi:hypothetical protein